MWAVILVVFELRTHLLFQVVLFFQLVLGLIDLSLKAVAGIVTDEAGFGSFGWALARRLLLNFSEVLQTRRCSGGRLELMRQNRELERLVPLVPAET